MLLADPPLPTLLAGAVAGTAALAWSGLAWVQALLPDDPDHDAESALVAVALAVGGSGSLAFWLNGGFGTFVVAPLLATLALAQVLALGGWRRWRGGDVAAVVRPDGRWRRLARAPWLWAALAAGLLWWVRHDATVPASSCLGKAALCAIGAGEPGCDVLRSNVGDVQLGNSAVVSVGLALFGEAGFRILFGLMGAMLALGGWALGRRGARLALGDAGSAATATVAVAGWIGLLSTAFNPYVLAIPLLDENLLTLAWTLATLALALVVRPPWSVVGALFGLAACMRHPLAVCAPALAALAWSKGGRWRAAGAVALGAVALTAFEHLHHHLAIGSVLQFEHNIQYKPQTYSLFGVAWQWKGLMNWPLYDHWVRTPHNPLPTAGLWPLWLCDHLGAVGLAALVGGALGLAVRCPRVGLFALGWYLPVHAGLSLQEAWDYPNKMGILLSAAAPWPLWWGAGVALLVRRPLWAVPALAVVAAGLWIGLGALQQWQVPADERYFAQFQLAPTESQSHLAWARQRAFDVGWLPDFGRATRYGTVWERLGQGLQRQPQRAWGWLTEALPEPGAAVVVTLDLRAPPWQGIALHPAELPAQATVDLDLTTAQGTLVAPGIVVPWEAGPLTVAAVRGAHLTLIELGFRDFRAGQGDCDPRLAFCHCRFFDTLDSGAAVRACAGERELRGLGPVVRLRIPAGGVSLFATVNPVGSVVYLWRGVVTTGRADLQGPVEFWHN